MRNLILSLLASRTSEIDAHYRARLFKYPCGQYIYLVKAISFEGLCKIGLTSEPSKRIADFDGGLPFPIHILAIIPSDNMRRMERNFHLVYKDKRVRGEWFRLNREDIERFQSRARAHYINNA